MIGMIIAMFTALLVALKVTGEVSWPWLVILAPGITAFVVWVVWVVVLFGIAIYAARDRGTFR